METVQSATVDPVAHDIAEVEAAIALVTAGAAVRVRLACLPAPLAVAGPGLALAQAAGVAFQVTRSESGAVTIDVGPRLGLHPVGGG